VLYDTSKVSYETLLNVFWHQINPTTPNQQFVDKGPQYRSAVFYHTPDQKAAAVRAAAALCASHAACLHAAHGCVRCADVTTRKRVCACARCGAGGVARRAAAQRRVRRGRAARDADRTRSNLLARSPHHRTKHAMRCDAMRCAMRNAIPDATTHRSSFPPRAFFQHRPAEQYHQDYYMKKNSRYKVYRSLSGRDAYIESVWGEAAVADHAVSM
jgi:peptide methionine sulfoxide reductase MsrA